MPRKNPVIKSKKALKKIRVLDAMETDEFWDKIFEAISSGVALFEYCQVENIPRPLGSPFFHSPIYFLPSE